MYRAKNSIIVIEDDIPLAINLKIHLTKWGYDVLKTFDNGEKALLSIFEERPQFILMDIKLAGHLTGIEVARKISNLNIAIIFMTLLTDESVFNDAKKTKGISYLVKPFNMLTLKGALEMAKGSVKENSTIFLRRGNQSIPVEISSIIWIKSDRNYCEIFTEQGRFSLRKSMVKLINELPTDKIVKIHRQYAISIDRIEKIWKTKGEIELKSGKILPVGRTYKNFLIQAVKTR